MHSDFQRIYNNRTAGVNKKLGKKEYYEWIDINEYDDTKPIPILLSLVVGTNKEKEFICFWNSLNQFMSIPCEVIISDFSPNFFTSNCIKTCSEFLIKLKINKEYPPLGFVKAYNKMFREVQGKYVVWLNDDCEFISNWDKFAIDFMERNNDVGMGAIYFSQDYPNYGIGCDEGLVYANFGVIRKEIGDEMGWFDERFHMDGSDTALSYKLLQNNYIVCGIPGCNIKHNMDHVWRKTSPAAKKRFDVTTPIDEKTFEKIYRPIMHSILERKEFMKKLKKYNRIINFRYV